ncbi:MAG: chemotaxis protein CheW [Acidobacteria bacterium]|nr:chemotaxis protein CheW [Acidobacteriota bacterium]
MAKLIVVKSYDKFLGVSSKNVKEVVEIVKIHPSPFVMPSIKGTAFWRGAVLTVVSLKVLLGANFEDDSHLYLRLSPFENLLLEINKIEDIIEYNELKLIDDKSEKIYKGIYDYKGNYVSVLDIENLCLSVEEEVIGTLRYGVNWR